MKIFSLLFLCFVATDIVSAEVPSPITVLDNSACLQCHENQTLIRDWQDSAHAKASPIVNCVSCHGGLHENIASKARRDENCIACHGGEKAPVVHSYSTSKHGILMKLEKNNYDWNQPFELANYRAPGCAYCHMHRAGHNVSATVRSDLMTNQGVAAVQDEIRAVCQDCHSPRYIASLFSNGEAMLEIGRKKVREAEGLIKLLMSEFSENELEPLMMQVITMRQHLLNVSLGVGHQSPDYQWWHGQPALDGDLLRIKDSISELRRTKLYP